MKTLRLLQIAGFLTACLGGALLGAFDDLRVALWRKRWSA